MWVDKAPPAKKPALTPLLRPRPGQQISGTLCGEPLRVFLHFTNGKSWPCIGRGCCLCEQQIPRRYYSYYPVRDSKGTLGIMELTGQAEDLLDEQMFPFSQVPCGEICVRRAEGRRNMPCTVEWKEPLNGKNTGGGKVDVKELQASLMRIWNLPNNDGDLPDNEYLASLNETIRARTKTS